jgi:hypothetical protein
MTLAFTCLAIPAAAGARITVVNGNAPDVGFNDPTPVAPVGGNPETTKGAQRLYAFRYAAELWGQTLDSPVEIVVLATFEALGANVLGSAGATGAFRDFDGVGLYPGAEFDATWYGAALADKRAGENVEGHTPDIRARFSSDSNFYLGIDNNHGAQNDLVTVVLHELGHGLNFQTFVTKDTGANLGTDDDHPLGFTDIYARHLFDTQIGLHWNDMTATERQASALHFGRLVWDGATVTHDVPNVLSIGSPEVRVTAPASIAGLYQFGTAAFGPQVGQPDVSSAIVPAVDAANAAGPSTTDGCTAFTNASAVAGKIALVERGTCGFAVKARNATNAGAAAVIIYNNAANATAAAPGMADDGVNGPFVTIPAVSLSRPDALAILAALPANADLRIDPTVRAGADAQDRARLYAPTLLSSGSSVSHFDSIAFRNLLMEPAINPDLTHNLSAPYDLTLELFRDIGWFADADLDGIADAGDCEAHSNRSETLVIGGEDTGVPNPMFTNGCTLSDLIGHIETTARNHGGFVSGVAHLTNALVGSGLISGAQKGVIQSAAAHAK